MNESSNKVYYEGFPVENNDKIKKSNNNDYKQQTQQYWKHYNYWQG